MGAAMLSHQLTALIALKFDTDFKARSTHDVSSDHELEWRCVLEMS